MKCFNCSMTSSLFSSFQENTKCESLFFADTCTRRVPIFLFATSISLHIHPYYLISGEYDGKFKYLYRTPRVFAVEIRKYHHKNRLENFYEIEQCKIAINNKLAILEQRKLTIPYYIQYTRRM
jgi:hypothetical protein